MKLKGLLLGSVVMLVACGERADDQTELDYASFDDAALAALAEHGEFKKVIDIVRGQDQLGISDKADHLLAAKIYNQSMNGVAAEVEIEKALEAGASRNETAVPLARSFLVQRRLDKALDALDGALLSKEDAYQALLIRGDVARDKEDYEAAKRFFEEAVGVRPNDTAGYLGLATMYLSENKMDEADRLAAKAHDLSPEDPVVSHVRGTIARYTGDREQAVSYLEAALEKKPAFVLALLELAGTQLDRGNIAEARRHLDTVYSITPENPMAYYLSALALAIEQQPKEAEYLLLRTGDLTRDYPPAARTYGLVAFQLRKFETARPYLERFLRRVPSDRLVRLALVECMSYRGDHEEALALLAPLTEEGSSDLEANMLAATAAGSLGDIDLARSYIQRARTLASEGGPEAKVYADAMTRKLAITRFMSGDQDEAISALSKLYDADQKDLTSLTLLANMQLDRGDTQGLADSIAKLKAIDPESAVAHNLEGALAYRQKNLQEALDHFNKALTKKPDYDSALKNRALANLALGHFDAARADLEPLVDRLPDDGQLRAMYGRVLFELGEPRAALVELKVAEDAIPTSAIIATDHALVLGDLGYFSSAVAQGEKAAKLAAGDQKLAAYIGELMTSWREELSVREKESEAERRKRLLKAKEADAEREAQRQRILNGDSDGAVRH